MVNNKIMPEGSSNKYQNVDINKHKNQFKQKTLKRNNSMNSIGKSGGFFIKPSQALLKDDDDNKRIMNDFHKESTISLGNDPDISTNNSLRNKVDKKPFDKKAWRLKKYSKKYKLQQWEDRRKKAVIREYSKDIKTSGSSKFNIEEIYQQNNVDDDDDQFLEEENDDNLNANRNEEQVSSRRRVVKPFKKAHEEFQRIKGEKRQRKDEFLKIKTQKEEQRRAYKKKKWERSKMLNRKTKKGQPIMKERMELLLEKIQNDIHNN